MPLFELFKGYPFPGAFAKFAMPPGPDDWQPKSWGIYGYMALVSNIFHAPLAHFIDDGVAINDVIYITQASPPTQEAAIVLSILGQEALSITYAPPEPISGAVYKVGMKAPHTLQSISSIVLARALYAATIHWALVWTQVPFLDFNHDETGDVYVCHNPGEKRLEKLLQQTFTDKNGDPIPNPWLNLNPEPVP